VTIDWVTVGDPGNDPDDTGYGSVPYSYLISKYETTNAQYAEFLNAVAATDTNRLYSSYMDLGTHPMWHGGITRSGSSGSYTYSTIPGRESMPVNIVSFYDALRFANWLHNGQPTGAQGNTTTEDGAYTITADGITNNTITRNADATIFLTSEDEWYKAAYYDAVSATYFDMPTGTDEWATCALPGPTPNTANCWPAGGDLTDVGSYTGSASPNETFDQGGNVWEWNETISGVSRGVRGGGFYGLPGYFEAQTRATSVPRGEQDNHGFRVASIPEPTTAVEIDIKPGSDPNSINPFSRGVIPVAILTTDDFDALTVDADSVLFGPDEAEKRHKRAHVEDVDCDGDLDLLLHFRTQDTGIAPGDTEACVTGETLVGVPIMGCDSVRTVPPN
jgi:formylglycine-generating enzyme required for sulfatase activity